MIFIFKGSLMRSKVSDFQDFHKNYAFVQLFLSFINIIAVEHLIIAIQAKALNL